MTDVRLPGQDGLEVLPLLRGTANRPVVVMTAFGNLEVAVRAVERGAFEYLVKPFDLDHALTVIKRAVETVKLGDKPLVTSRGAVPPETLLVGESPLMQSVFRKIALVAREDVPVLITGESGTGKELVATALHRYGNRQEGPFVPICLPALSESLVESELFGHRAGAFTGAKQERRGLLAQAHGGIAFFDEIGDISPELQVKLLRVLETKSITPVGGNQAVPSDFRLVAATNRPLEDLVRRGEFREDLYFRLSVFLINLPPLRQRQDDVVLLARHFLHQLHPDQDYSLSPRTLAELRTRAWRGNVRELRNAIEHAAIMCRSRHIEPEDLSPPISFETASNAPVCLLTEAIEHWLEEHSADVRVEGIFNALLQSIEPTLFKYALRESGGNRQEAAKLLGIHRQTLREKMRKYGLDVEEEAAS
jgi:two-component system nitrogen regulation response regulator GlnG